jgi:hypothetical protein
MLGVREGLIQSTSTDFKYLTVSSHECEAVVGVRIDGDIFINLTVSHTYPELSLKIKNCANLCDT